MLNKSKARINKFIIHRVGNKFNETKNIYSKNCVSFDENSYEYVHPFLLNPFINNPQSYRFTHHADINLNEINIYTQTIFKDNEKFIEYSSHIVKHLYEQSNSANIKTGDVFIALFDNLIYEERPIQALGVYKIENKIPYFQIFNDDMENLDIIIQKGISSKKIDKGCLILNYKDNDGNIIYSVDNNNYDTLYWTKHFLNIKYAEDNNRYTETYLDLCENFAKEILLEENNKKQQAEFLSDTISFFTDNEFLNINSFIEEVLPEEKQKESFKTYKNNYEKDRGLTIMNSFEISLPVFSKARKKIKSEIKLDTNILIKIDLNDPYTAKDNLEMGFDEERKMKYYKVYFNEEI